MQSQILSRYSRDQFWKLGLLKDGVIWLSRQGIKAVTGGIWYFPRMGTWNSDEERITPKKVPTSIVQKVRAAKEPPEWPSITVFILYSVLKSIHWKSSYRTMDWPGLAWSSGPEHIVSYTEVNLDLNQTSSKWTDFTLNLLLTPVYCDMSTVTLPASICVIRK